jgi:hypothetical protein
MVASQGNIQVVLAGKTSFPFWIVFIRSCYCHCAVLEHLYKVHNSVFFYHSDMLWQYCANLREFLHQVLKVATIRKIELTEDGTVMSKQLKHVRVIKDYTTVYVVCTMYLV